MRLALDPRARRLLRRVPRSTVYTAMELALLSLLALQGARLVWTVLTPVGPVGEWKAESALRPALPQGAAALGDFDPFFRLSGDSGQVVVTSLDLKLFGVRENRATGRGSAIIGTPDGEQRSFAVGEEIVPGVTLMAVNFDSVTISRGGTAEQMFLDQSPPATVVGPADVGQTAAAPAPASAPAASQIGFEPRMDGGRVTGVVVQPRGSGDAFRAAGFAPGDLILSVNGRQVGSAAEARALAEQLGGNEEVTVRVERDGRVIPLRVGPNR